MRKLLLMFALWTAPVAAGAACFDISKFEPATLTGRLSARIFAGPPGFEDVAKGDAAEPGYILKLPNAICLTGDPDFTDPEDMFDEVQLVSRDNTADRMAALDGRKVTVELSGHVPAHTGHHRRPLVAWVDEIVAEEPPASEESAAAATVRAFYQALTAGDGKTASTLVVEEKRRKGPFSAKELSRFYGALAEPLELVAVEDAAKGSVTVRYRYATKSKKCNGSATVRTTERNGVTLISGIVPKNEC